MEEHNHSHHELSKSKDNSALYTPIAIVVAGLLVATGLFFGLSKTGTSAPVGNGQQAPQIPVDIKKVNTVGEPFIGNANAPVVIAFWSDYQCPYCKAFEVGGVPQIPTPSALPSIVEKYVATGKVKIVFKDFAFLGADSNTGAEYGRAVWDLYPAQYFAWRTAMYKAQDQEGDQGFGNAASIDKLTATIPGIDAVKVAAQVKAKQADYDKAAQADMQEATTMGINGTPAFIIGKTLISGAQALPAFTAAIDAQLK